MPYGVTRLHWVKMTEENENSLQTFWNAFSIENFHIWIIISLKSEDHSVELIDYKSVSDNELVPAGNKPLLEPVLSKKNDAIWHC